MPDLVARGLVSAASTWLLTYLLHSTVVVGVVWALARAGWVRRPTTLDLLWKVALVATLATASWASVRPFRVVSREVAVEIRELAGPGRLSWEGGGAAGPDVVRVQALAVDPSPACREALGRLRADPGAGATHVRRACQASTGSIGSFGSFGSFGVMGVSGWRGLLLAVWLLGAGWLLGRAVLVRRSLGRILRDARPAPEAMVREARSLLPRSRRPVDVLVSPWADAPCVVGRRVVLPVRCARDLTPDQIRAVLAHEVAHVRRRDPAWIAFGDLLGRALWLQPLNRLALEGLRESAELACDDWAVDRAHPLELARSIARVAEWVHPGHGVDVPALAHLAPLARGEGRILSGRVRRILTSGAARRPAPRLLRLALAALVVAPALAMPPVPRGDAVYAVFLRREVGQDGPAALVAPGVMHGDDVAPRVRGLPTG